MLGYKRLILTVLTCTIISTCSKDENSPITEPPDSDLPKITWELSGIDSLRINVITRGPGSGIFAGTDEGIFKSSDHGVNWQLSGLDNFEITDLVSYSMVNVIYAGTINNGVFLSRNRGYTWEQCGLNGISVHKLHVIYGVLIASTPDSGLYCSSNTLSLNSPIVWEKINTGLPITQPVFSFFGNSPLLAGSYGVYTSSDVGKTWTFNSSVIASSKVCAITKMAGHTIVGTDGNGIFRASNNTTDWEQVNSGFNDTKILGFCFNSNTHLFAGTSDNGVFRSTDMGINWMQVNDSLFNKQVRSLYNDYGYIFAATTGGVYKSSLVDKPVFP
jgi:ligand-binding sensor domain-containing protein